MHSYYTPAQYHVLIAHRWVARSSYQYNFWGGCTLTRARCQRPASALVSFFSNTPHVIIMFVHEIGSGQPAAMVLRCLPANGSPLMPRSPSCRWLSCLYKSSVNEQPRLVDVLPAQVSGKAGAQAQAVQRRTPEIARSSHAIGSLLPGASACVDRKKIWGRTTCVHRDCRYVIHI